MVGVGLFTQVISDGSNCARRHLDQILGKIFFPEMFVWHWNRLVRAVMESSSLEVLKKRVDVSAVGRVWW